MARRRNIWEQIWESTEGPTVTVTIPRELADALLQSLAAGLEQELPGEDMGDDEDLGSMDDLDFGGEEPDMDDMGGPPDGDEDDMGLGMDMPAGDDGDEDDEPAPPTKRGPGRPPGAKNKKKDDGGKKKAPTKDDDSDDDKDKDEEETKDEAAGDYRPQTALGESTFAKLSRALAAPRKRR
jgi:hypothetical protein